MNNLIIQLFKPVDIASIVFVRIFLGLILFVNVLSYITTPYLKAVWIEPEFHFKYLGFYWVETVPETYLSFIVFLVALSALFIAIGLIYRISTIIFFVGFSYLFLLDQSLYLNHYYLVILVSFLLIFIPANRSLSVDSLIWPRIRSSVISSWCVWILMFQIGVVYVFGGIAKINADWLHGWPLKIWLEGNEFTNGQYREIFAYSLSYLGLLFDILIVPLLLYRRTRIIGFIVAIIFHTTNKLLFDIGIFPYVSILLTTLYFTPGWPRIMLGLKTPDVLNQINVSNLGFQSRKLRQFTVFILLAYVIIQLLFPLRHFLYPGNVSWTEEGHKFAWQMKLRDKTGNIRYFIRDPKTGKEWELNPKIYLTDLQIRKFATRPNLIIQFAHYMEKQFKGLGYEDVEVRARGKVSLNGRKMQLIVDPNVDLTLHRESFMPADWIMPLVEPLKTKK
ncbi:MAG: HTTM domain-containing protein [Thermodesulfobacteriota bacterium]